MATLNVSKTSGVLFTTVGSNQPVAYFGANGSYVPFDDLTGVIITIRSGINPPVTFNVLLTDLLVNGQSPTNIDNAKQLLNAVFGS